MCKGERMTGSVYRTTCKLLYSLLRRYCVITTVYKYKSERTLHWTVLKILWTSAFNYVYKKRSDQQLMIGHSKFCLFNVATALKDGYRAMNTYSDCLREPRRRSGGERGIKSMYKDNSVMPLSSNTTLFESRMRTDSITCKKTYKTQPLLQNWSETFQRQWVLNLVIWVLKTETKDELITQTSSYRLYTKYLIYH